MVSDHPVMPTWWTNYPLLTPLLTGWVGGPRAEALAALPDDEIIAQAISALAEILNWPRARLAALIAESYVHNWSRDPFTRGGYTYVASGGQAASDWLAQPIADTLYFAGEATCNDGNNGMLHGALATGLRAARQIIGE